MFIQPPPPSSSEDLNAQNKYNLEVLKELDPANAMSVFNEAYMQALSLYLANILLAVVGCVLFVYLMQQLFVGTASAAADSALRI